MGEEEGIKCSKYENSKPLNSNGSINLNFLNLLFE